MSLLRNKSILETKNQSQRKITYYFYPYFAYHILNKIYYFLLRLFFENDDDDSFEKGSHDICILRGRLITRRRNSTGKCFHASLSSLKL